MQKSQVIKLNISSLSPENQDAFWILIQMYYRYLLNKDIIPILLISTSKMEASIVSHKNLTQLSGEAGVHRICKISPFDKQKRRHTNFVTVSVNGAIQEHVIVRSYLFDPIKLVRNISNKKKTDKLEEVLAGNLDLLF